MLDPRIDLANMLHELREKLNNIEMKLWEIPHHQEPVEEYEAVLQHLHKVTTYIQQHQLIINQKASAMRLTGTTAVSVGWNLPQWNGTHTIIVTMQMHLFHMNVNPIHG